MQKKVNIVPKRDRCGVDGKAEVWVMLGKTTIDRKGEGQVPRYHTKGLIGAISRLYQRVLQRIISSRYQDPGRCYSSDKLTDGLTVIRDGRKQSRLSGSEWHQLLISPSSQQAIVNRVRCNQLSEWARVILLETSPGEKVLEIGSGTGEISLHLAKAGRIVTALDISAESLEFIRRCAAELEVEIGTVQADATQPLPFMDDEFDCVWSSGLLEHFTADERRSMLREQRRITRNKVIAMVPNAACVAYRAGKKYQEERGIWKYGLEIPILSLREDFEAAGLHVVSEYSVGARHALKFLPANHPLRKALSEWIDSLSPEELRDCNQGYLLVTIGVKKTAER